MANPRELQVEVEDNPHKAMDLRKIYKFVRFTRHKVSMHHTFKDTKEAFIRTRRICTSCKEGSTRRIVTCVHNSNERSRDTFKD